MATACPHCAAPAAFAEEKLGASGRFLRCARCGRAWMEEHPAAESFGRRAVDTALRPKAGPIIDHIAPGFERTAFAGPAGKVEAPPRRSFSFSRGTFALAAGALLLGSFVLTLVFGSSLVGAAQDRDLARYAGLEIRLVRGAVGPARNGHALTVEGEITNRGKTRREVPAVEVAVKSGGLEMASWRVEPLARDIDAGATVAFRSVRAASSTAGNEVTLRFADRQGGIIGAE